MRGVKILIKGIPAFSDFFLSYFLFYFLSYGSSELIVDCVKLASSDCSKFAALFIHSRFSDPHSIICALSIHTNYNIMTQFANRPTPNQST